jgi:hypothetical protein
MRLIRSWKRCKSMRRLGACCWVQSKLTLFFYYFIQRGNGIGQRLVDELLAKSGLGSCADFKETAEVIAKVGFKMFLGSAATVSKWNAEETAFSLLIDENPLVDFVELPEHLRALKYCNVLCGVIRGALEMVNLKVECDYVRCTLWGDETTEIRVRLCVSLPPLPCDFVPLTNPLQHRED